MVMANNNAQFIGPHQQQDHRDLVGI